MADYWKSTPKQWCKYCKTYVPDTPIEKSKHDATSRHQGNLRRFLKDLHRTNERETRDKDAAKREVERLNGVVSGKPAASSSVGPGYASGFGRKPPGANANMTPLGAREPTADERKRQLAQLADMGVAIPEEFRGEMAMAGEWESVARPLPSLKQEEEDSKERVKSVGVRKRKPLPGEEEDGEGEGQGEKEKKRRIWGSSTKTWGDNEDGGDLDALLKGGFGKRKVGKENDVKAEPASLDTAATDATTTTKVPVAALDGTRIKREPSNEDTTTLPPTITEDGITNTDATIEPESADVKKKQEDGADGGVVFKKRKAKNIR